MAKKRGTRLLDNYVLRDIIDSRLKLFFVAVEKSRFLIAISGIIFTITITQLASEDFLQKAFLMRIGLIVILCSTVFSILVSIKADKTKGEGGMGIFNIKKDPKKLKIKDYENFLTKITSNKKNVINEYSKEIFSLDKIIAQQFKEIRMVTYVLTYGLVIGGFLIIFGLI